MSLSGASEARPSAAAASSVDFSQEAMAALLAQYQTGAPVAEVAPKAKEPAPAPSAAKSATTCAAYSCAWDTRLSDHKPVFAIIDVDLDAI